MYTTVHMFCNIIFRIREDFHNKINNFGGIFHGGQNTPVNLESISRFAYLIAQPLPKLPTSRARQGKYYNPVPLSLLYSLPPSAVTILLCY